MVTFIILFGFFSMPVIAFVFAKFWVFCGYLWCLSIYPESLDRLIYTVVLPLLSDDISIAAGQVDLIEAWGVSIIIMELFWALMVFTLKDKLASDL